MPSCLKICLTLISIIKLVSNCVLFTILTLCGILEHLLTTIDDSSNTRINNSYSENGLMSTFPCRFVSTESQTEIIYFRPKNRMKNNCTDVIYNSDISKQINKTHLNEKEVEISSIQTYQTKPTDSADTDDKKTRVSLSGYFSGTSSTCISLKPSISDANSSKFINYFQNFLLPISQETSINKLNIIFFKAPNLISLHDLGTKFLLNNKNITVGDQPIMDLMPFNTSESHYSKFCKIVPKVEMTYSNNKLKKIDAHPAILVKNMIKDRKSVFSSILHDKCISDKFSNTVSKLEHISPIESDLRAYVNDKMSVSSTAFDVSLNSRYSTIEPVEVARDHKSLICSIPLGSYRLPESIGNYPNKTHKFSIRSFVALSEYLNSFSRNRISRELKEKLKEINQFEYFSEIDDCQYGLKISNTKVEYLLKNLLIQQLSYLPPKNGRFIFETKVLLFDNFNSDNFDIKYTTFEQFRILNNRKPGKDFNKDNCKTALIGNDQNRTEISTDSSGRSLADMNISTMDRNKQICKAKIIFNRSRNERASCSILDSKSEKSEKNLQSCFVQNVPTFNETKLAGAETSRQTIPPKAFEHISKQLKTAIDKGSLAGLMQDLKSQTNESFVAMFEKMNEVVEFLDSNPAPSKDAGTPTSTSSRRSKKKRRKNRR